MSRLWVQSQTVTWLQILVHVIKFEKTADRLSVKNTGGNYYSYLLVIIFVQNLRQWNCRMKIVGLRQNTFLDPLFPSSRHSIEFYTVCRNFNAKMGPALKSSLTRSTRIPNIRSREIKFEKCAQFFSLKAPELIITIISRSWFLRSKFKPSQPYNGSWPPVGSW